MGNHQGRGQNHPMFFETAEEIEMRLRNIRPKRPQPRYTAQERQRALAYLEYGTSARQIARSMRCSPQTILRWRDEARRIEADRVRREDFDALNAALAKNKPEGN